MSANEFAELLRELKERSGLSYGMLAKRLHMSTSTLHRYCNGDAVPADYAPVERLARLCKASPQELVELHRRWVLADAVRGRRPGVAEAAVTKGPVVEGAVVEAVGTEAGAAVVDEGVGEAAVADETVVTVRGGDEGRGGASRWARRPVLLAGVGVVAALGSVALALSLSLPSGGSGQDGDGAAADAASVQGKGSARVSPSPSASPSGPASPSVTPSLSASASASAKGGGAPAVGARSDDTVPLTVRARPYAWESPCDQHYLIEREPGQVAPPPVEQDAPAWVAAHGAVSSGAQFLELTVQGTGQETVVVDDVKVRTVEKSSPLAWNDYAMGYPGVGCGGGVPTRFFTVALDAARPALVPEAGHAGFPFKVSASDPEVYYVLADASAYDVRWQLELSWSSGSRHGTLTVDDDGKAFRTSGNNGRPAYEFPLGGSAWERAGASPTP
ncbi:helix-turn-helix domain-containing protein [Streptomyces zaehneri]|uniref:helix-turn-helix domain-containing protein n=1 Tax=Streptomyces zaehneri TaxID=3051180 RepID=UPI0028CFD7F1|nr:helix-turn-helix transcriptional regulator [Streptomyces sp. DSM 40713]